MNETNPRIKMRTIAVLAALFVGMAGLAPDVSWADRDDKGKGHGHKGHGKDKGRGGDSDRDGDVNINIISGQTVVIPYDSKASRKALKHRGGPPPWAPAHGYRRKGGHPDYYPAVYAAPFGIDMGGCNRDIIGGLLGGVAGGALGSTIGQGSGKTVAIVGGTILGAIVGGSIGRSMDQADMTCVGQALEHAPSGRPVQWNGAGGSYMVKPVNAFQSEGGQYCREYTTQGTIGGKPRTLWGTACRMPDGSWQKVG
jgi:surface antigen